MSTDAQAPPRKSGQLRELLRLDASFWVSNWVYALDGAAYFGILNLLDVFLVGSIGMSDERAGLSISIFTGFVTLSNLLLGKLADRLGARHSITLGGLGSVLGRALLALAPTLPHPHWMAWLSLALMGTAQGVLIPAAYTAVKQATTEKTSAVGFSLLYALPNGGALLAGLASSPLRKAYGMAAPMWMCAGFSVLYLVLHLVAFPRDKGRPAPPAAKAEASSWRDTALLNPRFLFFIFVLLGVRTLFAHQWLTLPPYIMRSYPAAVSDHLEWFESINAPVVLVLTPLVAAFTRKANVVTMMIAGTFVSAMAGFLLVPAPTVTALVAYYVIFSIGEALWSSRFYEYVAHAAPADKVGVYMGIAQVPWFLAKFTTGFYSGAMLTRYCPATGPRDTATLWLIYTCVGLSSPIGLFVARRWLQRGGLTKP